MRFKSILSTTLALCILFCIAYNGTADETHQQDNANSNNTSADVITDVLPNINENSAILASFQPGDYITFGTYPQGPNGEVQPIEWLILNVQEGKALLISRYGLDVKSYNAEYCDTTWEQCTLRTWLNNDFLSTAFTIAEQEAILLSNVDNSKAQCNNSYNTTGGNNTQDKIFLLSYAEVH